jgi:hypothetical protein
MNSKKRLTIGLFLLCLMVVHAQRHERFKPLSTKDLILMKLDTIDRMYLSQLRPRDHFEASKQLIDVMLLIDRLEKEKDNRDKHEDRGDNRDWGRNREPDTKGGDSYISPMTQQDFDQLLGAIDASSFDRDKKKIISASSLNHYFLIEQVIKIAQKFSFDNDKLEIIEKLYPKITDLDKNYLLYNCFVFSDSKNKLDKFIEENSKNKGN